MVLHRYACHFVPAQIEAALHQRFIVGPEIAAGGQGAVFKASRTSLPDGTICNDIVALKLHFDRRRSVRPRPEIMTTENFSHPNLARLVGQARAFIKEMGALELDLIRLPSDIPSFEGWKVAEYLKEAQNQSKEGWPEVLGVWCRTYCNLLTANMMLCCLADPKTMTRRLAEVFVPDKKPVGTQELDESDIEKIDTSPMTTKLKGNCEDLLLQLEMIELWLRRRWEDEKAQLLTTVQNITKAARERGLYAHLGYRHNSLVLYVAPGNGRSDPLKWGDCKSNTEWLRSISIHLPKAQKDSFTPKYELLARTGQGRIDRHSLDSITGVLSDAPKPEVIKQRPGGIDEERFVDVCGIAINDGHLGIDFSTQPETLVAIAIKDREPGTMYYMNYYTLDRYNKGTRVNYSPPLAGIQSIRCLYLPPTALSNDPDASAMADSNASPPGPALLRQNTPVVYGGVGDANDLWVVAWDSWATVRGPQGWKSYNGIEVDPYYVWLFGKHGIACATHASIIKCRQDKNKGMAAAGPSWIYHKGPEKFTAPEVMSLYPCIDGTLLVSMLDNIYTADYEIKRSEKGNSIDTSSWVERGGQAKQVIKMPIPCWSVFQSLKERLQSA